MGYLADNDSPPYHGKVPSGSILALQALLNHAVNTIETYTFRRHIFITNEAYSRNKLPIGCVPLFS